MVEAISKLSVIVIYVKAYNIWLQVAKLYFDLKINHHYVIFMYTFKNKRFEKINKLKNVFM